jgi:DNA-binding CsgD family transcriptional regulator
MQLTKEQLDRITSAFHLSPRESQIIDLLFQGYTTNVQLAAGLGVTEGSAKNLVHDVLAKMRCRDKASIMLACFALLHA